MRVAFLCFLCVVFSLTPYGAEAARSPEEAVAALAAAARIRERAGLSRRLGPGLAGVLTKLARSGDAWQRADDAFRRAFAEKFGLAIPHLGRLPIGPPDTSRIYPTLSRSEMNLPSGGPHR